MQIEDQTILGWAGALGAALLAGIAWGGKVVWGAVKELWDRESGCQKRLARLEGVMALQAQFERRKELRDVMVSVANGEDEHDKMLAELTGDRRGNGHK